ncbi:MAG: DUF998 domain-containing protein [Planctomycetota bacterium]|jgi:hypothetical protein
MSQQTEPERSLVISYLGLRRAIGITAMALPFVVVFGKMLLDGPGLESSISGYYHTVMRDVLVGCLCAIGVFFMSYRGYDGDNAVSNLAGVLAIGVALFPTSPVGHSAQTARIISAVHGVCAACLFLTLAFFCLRLFTKTNMTGPGKEPTPRKLQRNIVYRACGYTILACVVLMPVALNLPGDSLVRELSPVFWLETVAVLAFGVSWFTKGEAILADVEAGA